MTWNTSGSFEDLFDALSTSLSTTPTSNTKIYIKGPSSAPYNDELFLHTITSAATDVKFITPTLISAASMQGSELVFTRKKNSTSNYVARLKNLSIILSTTPSIAPIYSDFQGPSIIKPKLKTLWNLDGTGSFALSGNQVGAHTTGSGNIDSKLEGDGYYHLRVHTPAFTLIGETISPPQIQKPYATGSLNDFWSELGISSAIFYGSLQSSDFASIDLDLRFSTIN